jgi:hypothetical protein
MVEWIVCLMTAELSAPGVLAGSGNALCPIAGVAKIARTAASEAAPSPLSGSDTTVSRAGLRSLRIATQHIGFR